MSDKPTESIEEILPGIGDAMQSLLSGMMDQGNRRGVLHVRPEFGGIPADYELRFAVTATMIPDKPKSRRREKP